MQSACYDGGMAKTIQIRDVPDDVHRDLRVRAAAAGTSLSRYCLEELTKAARRPPIAEVLQRARGRGVRIDNDQIVAAVRSWRDRE